MYVSMYLNASFSKAILERVRMCIYHFCMHSCYNVNNYFQGTSRADAVAKKAANPQLAARNTR